MKVLLIEDEQDFVERFRVVTAAEDIILLTVHDVGLNKNFADTSSIEQQLFSLFSELRAEKKVDIVVLDTDLSKIRTGISQASCRAACLAAGIPVCRYTKRHSQTAISHVRRLSRIGLEGSSAVWVPPEMVKGDLPGLALWLLAVHAGFSELVSFLTQYPDLETAGGPAVLLADALGCPEISADFLGYTAQNVFFFAPSETDDEMSNPVDPVRLSTQLGYWLLNYILEFPGPILHSTAAAAFLNIEPSLFESEEIQGLVSSSKYQGPFGNIAPLFWRHRLLQILDQYEGDIANAPLPAGFELTRVDTEHPDSAAYFCVLSQQPIAASDAGPNPDWIPAGAQLACIKEELYEELGPLLSI
ncbi:hypothetical protein [Massilia sp. Leaf139]|uniref:hypothetical protein n=1 Tax=Massilia sp. Leaf139 TaxID=1736272 RepID=UPI000AB69D7C|nr:hypothetical protein [Massilia sp. Leaf139]